MLAVEMRHITKRFGGLAANDAVDFSVRKGEIHALVGENGAGKSTLMNILYGFIHPDEGEIFIAGNQVRLDSPRTAIGLGIGMVHQHFMLIPPLTVLENIVLGQEPTRAGNILNVALARETILRLSKAYHLAIDPAMKVSNLSVGLQQRVEILKILYRNADVLILDEPTPVLTPQEVEDLFNTLRDLKAQGKTVILITHKLGEVTAISDTVTVMRRGRIVKTMETRSTTRAGLSTLMVGKEVNHRFERLATTATRPVLTVERVSALDDRRLPAVRDVSFSVNAGEIVGIAAVEGNGQSELIQAITGLRRISAGRIMIDGTMVAGSSLPPPIAHIPEDRQKRALVLDFTLAENLILGRQREPRYSGRWGLHHEEILADADQLIRQFDIRPPDREQPARGFSGGNQQKAVIARELSKQAGLVVASQPTRGLDIGATDFVHHKLLDERNEGKAVLLVSSDLEELLLLSDRILVLYEGAIAAVVNARGTSERELGAYMTGAASRAG